MRLSLQTFGPSRLDVSSHGTFGRFSAISFAMESPPGRALTIERICASPSLCGPAPNGLKLAPDGKTVSYLKGRSTNKDFKDLWAMDVATQAHSVLVDADWLRIDPLSDEEKSRRERMRVGDASGIMDYDWSADSSQILIPAGAKIYMYSLCAGGVGRSTGREHHGRERPAPTCGSRRSRVT